MRKYELIRGDLLGNDEEGYDWNGSIPCGTYELDPDKLSEENDSIFLDYLISEGVFDGQARKAESFNVLDCYGEEIEIEFYFPQNAPRGKEVFLLSAHPANEDC